MKRIISLILGLTLLLGVASFLGACRTKENRIIESSLQLNDPSCTIGVGEGTAAANMVELCLPQAQRKYLNSTADGYLSVQKGKIDAFAFDRVSMEYIMAKEKLKGVMLLPEDVGEAFGICVGISPKTKIPDLTAKINSFLADIKANGVYADVYDRWIRRADDTMPSISSPEHPEGKFVVGTSGLVVPYSYYKGTEVTGFDLELVYRFANYMNYEVEIKVIDYPGLIAAAEVGEIDCIFANLNQTPERAEKIDFSDPIYESATALLVKSNGSAGKVMTSVSDLEEEGTRIGILTGTIFDELVASRFPKSVISYFETNTDLINRLENGQLDAFLTDEPTAHSIIMSRSGITYLEDYLVEDAYGMAFAKTDTGEKLCSEMNILLSELRQSGELQNIVQKWYRNEDSETDLSSGCVAVTGEKLRVAVCSAFPPFCMVKNGQIGGISVELAERFCERFGYSMEITDLNVGAMIPSLLSGFSDVLAGNVSITEERKEQLLFSDPYYNGGVVAVVRKSGTAEERRTGRTLAEMRSEPIKLGVLTGTANEEALYFPNAELSYFDSTSDILSLIVQKRLDGVVGDEIWALDIERSSPLYTHIYEPIKTSSFGIAFPKNADGEKIRLQFNEFLSSIRQNGTFDSLCQKWLYGNYDDQNVALPEAEGENGTLRFGMDSENPPFCLLKNGQYGGFEVELVAQFCHAYGYGLEISDVAFSGLLAGLGSHYDIVAGSISITEERAESVLFSDPTVSNNVVMLVRNEAMDDADSPTFWDSFKESFEKTFIRESRWKLIVEGIKTTIWISVLSAFFGTILGFGICMLSRVRNPILHAVTTVYIRVLQGTPMVVLLMILFYLVFARAGLSGEWVAVFAFTFNFSAYVSEMMRTGIDSIDRGQTEAALAIGFTPVQAFFRIVMPQAARHFLPVYKGEFISLVKMTSIVGYIAVQDLTKMSDIIRSRTYEAFFPLIATAILYFLISGLLALLLNLIEKKIEPNRKKRTVKGVVMQ